MRAQQQLRAQVGLQLSELSEGSGRPLIGVRRRSWRQAAGLVR